ncbi:MAG: Glucan endo-1,3-beta-glucosidase [Luteibacter sp.]|uniref:beta-1,3-glucanase family protein n=1 Tax=Luteibacter sp. TaxID=1886636 RepID=UPI00137E32B2|nr:beta-1,3-glucanase family protein [Luteibacter sp.]KAF1004089.1 MAG: Glucan endo-1,3-beta-glucosidase [Luteibacter sp.]
MKLDSKPTLNRIGRRAIVSALALAMMSATVAAHAAPQAAPTQSSPQAASAGTNLALNAPVIASDVENPIAFKADNVNDGDLGTRWSSGFTDDQWIQVDLGSVQSVGKVTLNWENAYAADYRIEVSVDGQSWQVADENPAGVGGVETRTFPAVSARYVRMHGVKRATGYGYSLWEMGVYAPDSTTGTPPNSGTNDPSQGFNYQVYPGFIGTQLRNVTNGQWRDDQIFVEILARDPNHKDAANQDAMSYITPDGQLVALNEADNNGPGHLTKNGNNYPNYAFTLAQAKLLKLPESSSGRIFVSFGEPMYMSVVKGADGSIGFAGPNPLNGTDPNVGIYYDWYEYTWNDNALFINTTQVDQFSIPLALDVYGGNKTRHLNSGITQTRAQVLQEYNAEVPVEFQLANANPVRILAPGKDAFDEGKPQGHYFDAYIDEVWNYYQTHTLTINRGAEQYQGSVVNGVLVFQHTNWAQTPNANEPEGFQFNVYKPTTQDVLEGKGNLARASDGDVWGVTPQLEAQICAAFNRHVMEDTTQWKNADAFYQQAPANYYSRFWHVHGVNQKAYGFAYDDVSDQSSTLIESQPEHLELGIGW